jgi:hypothetical protein
MREVLFEWFGLAGAVTIQVLGGGSLEAGRGLELRHSEARIAAVQVAPHELRLEQAAEAGSVYVRVWARADDTELRMVVRGCLSGGRAHGAQPVDFLAGLPFSLPL